jgi:hypothetical protein
MVHDMTIPIIEPENHQVWLSLLLDRLLDQLVDEFTDADLHEPLAAPVMLGCVLTDLLQLAGIEVPPILTRVVGERPMPITNSSLPFMTDLYLVERSR